MSPSKEKSIESIKSVKFGANSPKTPVTPEGDATKSPTNLSIVIDATSKETNSVSVTQITQEGEVLPTEGDQSKGGVSPRPKVTQSPPKTDRWMERERLQLEMDRQMKFYITETKVNDIVIGLLKPIVAKHTEDMTLINKLIKQCDDCEDRVAGFGDTLRDLERVIGMIDNTNI